VFLKGIMKNRETKLTALKSVFPAKVKQEMGDFSGIDSRYRRDLFAGAGNVKIYQNLAKVKHDGPVGAIMGGINCQNFTSLNVLK
jgi:hypothetical protein